MYPSPLGRVLAQLDSLSCAPSGNGKQFSAHCPAHDDGTPSLSVGYRNGRVLLRCHVGCTFNAILGALGLTAADLRTDSDPQEHPRLDQANTPWHDVASYVYTDEEGGPLYRVRRLERYENGKRQKKFIQGRHIGSNQYREERGCMDDVRRVPYDLPNVLAGVLAGETIWFFEGEKCVHAATRLDLTATTTVGGANRRWESSYCEHFRGARIAVVADNDVAGRNYGLNVARALRPVAAEVRLVELRNLPPKGDLIQYIDGGGTRESLLALYHDSPVFDETTEVPQSPSEAESHLSVVRLDAVETHTIEWFWPGRIAVGKLTMLDGNPGLGKSHLTIELAACITTGRALPGGSPTEPSAAVFVSLEDDPSDTMKPRAEAAGTDLTNFYLVKGIPVGNGVDRPLSLPEDVPHLRALVEKTGARLVVIDPITTHLGGGVDVYKDHSVRLALQPLATMAQATRCAVVIVRHLKKNHNGNALAAGGGSMGIIGIARGGLLVTEHPDDPTKRVLAVSKSNLGKFPPSLVFSIESADLGSQIEWHGEANFTADELLTASTRPAAGDSGALGDAVAWLAAQLEVGPQQKSALLETAGLEGIAPRTLERAKSRLGVVHRRGLAGYVWSLPDKQDRAATSLAISPTKACSPTSPTCTNDGERGELASLGERDAVGYEGSAVNAAPRNEVQ